MSTETKHDYRVLKQQSVDTAGRIKTDYSLTVDCYKQTTGVPVPGWKSKIATLQNASSAYDKLQRTLEAPSYSGKATLRRKSTGAMASVTWSGNWLASLSSLAIPAHDTSVVGSGVGKFYSKAADALSPFKGLVFAAELGESLQLIGVNGQRILKLYKMRHREVKILLRAYRRYIRWRPGSRVIATRRVLADASDLWLEWAFGVSPILSDIESAAEAFYGPKVEVRTVSCRFSGGKKVTFQSISKSFMPNNAAVYDVRTLLTKETDVRYKGALKCELPSRENPLRGSAERYGISFRQFVPTLWEITPWSFLVDYFVNVGQTLNAVAYHDAEWIYAVKTARTVSTLSYVSRWNPGPGDNTWAVTSCPAGSWSGKQTASRLNRSTLSIADAGLHVSYPPLGLKWANMLALALSKLRK
jgi:hypothetical protein